jgi:hypothetical protein
VAGWASAMGSIHWCAGSTRNWSLECGRFSDQGGEATVAERGFGTRYPSAWVCKASPVRFLGYPKYFFQNGLFSGISSEHENNHADTQKWPEFFGFGLLLGIFDRCSKCWFVKRNYNSPRCQAKPKVIGVFE